MPGRQETSLAAGRKLRCETLETRQMLSVNAGSLPELPVEQAPALVSSIIDNSLAARDQALAISAVHVLVDGRAVTLKSLEQPLQLNVGSSLEIVGIDYRLNGEEVVDGRIAFEGYLNKLQGSRVRTDYSDGRFGGHVQQGELPFGTSSHPGLDGEWIMQEGTESLTLVMVRYGQDEVVVEDRLTIQTQVGKPDFYIDPDIQIRGSSRGILAGRNVSIYGGWGNAGEGRYRSYAEVDIYHESDPNKIVWSGTLDDVVSADKSDSGRFVNKVRRDGFSRNWIPELGGTYTLKFYADPENHWNESNEENNLVTIKLEVTDPRQVARGRDARLGFGFNHHSLDDTAARDAALAAAASELAAPAVDTFEIPATSIVETATEAENRSIPAVVPTAPFVAPLAETLEYNSGNSLGKDNARNSIDWAEAIDLALSSPLL